MAARVGVRHTLPLAGPEVISRLRPLLTWAFSTTVAVNVSEPMRPISSVLTGHQSCFSRSWPTQAVEIFDSLVRCRSYSPRFVAVWGERERVCLIALVVGGGLPESGTDAVLES
jgi:hypothetical protein